MFTLATWRTPSSHPLHAPPSRTHTHMHTRTHTHTYTHTDGASTDGLSEQPVFLEDMTCRCVPPGPGCSQWVGDCVAVCDQHRRLRREEEEGGRREEKRERGGKEEGRRRRKRGRKDSEKEKRGGEGN